ncbi:hypothetical protein [Bdellovibrio sp. HCB274]|uniref:hypothetical protein n=1 Tax=Bdellovibrio sp. HCB274 TaxID=3394361 RepID=UPI0039B6C131
MKSDLFRFATCFAFMSLLASCAPVSENSLLSSDASNPDSHSLNTAPLSNELQLVADVYNLGSAATTKSIELSGACYTSTYPTHKITVSVNGGTPQAGLVFDMSGTTATGYGTCRNGRYNIVLQGSALGAGANNIVLTLTGYTAQSVAANSGNSYARYYIIRSN